MGEWLNKLWYIHTTKSYLSIKKGWTIDTTWLDLKDILLNEKSQLQKVKTVCFYLDNVLEW